MFKPQMLFLLFIFPIFLPLSTSSSPYDNVWEVKLAEGDYAEYEIAAAGVYLISGEVIHSEEGQRFKGSLMWTVTDISDVIEIDVSLRFLNLDKTVRFHIKRENLFIDGNCFGRNPFWITGLENGAVIPFYQQENGVVNGIAEGPYVRETIRGRQEYWDVTVGPLLTQKGYPTVIRYFYDNDSGFLLGIFCPADPLFNLFGIDDMLGNVTLVSTNVDIGPELPMNWFGVILEIWPVIAFVVIIAILFIVVKKRISARKQ